MKARWQAAKERTTSFWERLIYPVVVPIVIIVAVPLSYVGENYGLRFDVPFFTASAQVFPPLLLVALFVELAGVHERFSKVWRKALEQGIEKTDPALTSDSREFERKISNQAKKMIWLTVIGESAALYALAATKPTNFLGVLCVLCMAVTVYLLATAYLARIAPLRTYLSRPLPPEPAVPA